MNPADQISIILAASRQLLQAKCEGQIDNRTFNEQLKALTKEANRVYQSIRALVLMNRLANPAETAKTRPNRKKTSTLNTNA